MRCGGRSIVQIDGVKGTAGAGFRGRGEMDGNIPSLVRPPLRRGHPRFDPVLVQKVIDVLVLRCAAAAAAASAFGEARNPAAFPVIAATALGEDDLRGSQGLLRQRGGIDRDDDVALLSGLDGTGRDGSGVQEAAVVLSSAGGCLGGLGGEQLLKTGHSCVGGRSLKRALCCLGQSPKARKFCPT